jgi:hypothetical protein
MPKVELTARRTVQATSEWFTVNVNPTTVWIITPFGRMIVRRVRKGLEVNVEIAQHGDQFLEYTDAKHEAPTRLYDSKFIEVLLRPMGDVQVQEINSDPELEKHVRSWMKRKDKEK